MYQNITKLEGVPYTVYEPDGARHTVCQGKRCIPIRLCDVPVEELISGDSQTQYAKDFKQQLKNAKQTEDMKVEIWLPVEAPSYVELGEQVKNIQPETLENMVKEFAPKSGSRMMMLEEALFVLGHIAYKQGCTVEELCSVKGIENEILPYMTNRKNALLVKTKQGYAVIGAGGMFANSLPATDIKEISAGEYIQAEILPIMVMDGVFV